MFVCFSGVREKVIRVCVVEEIDSQESIVRGARLSNWPPGEVPDTYPL